MGALTRRYSERLGVLTDEQLQAAADRFDLGRVIGAGPAPGGLFGQNVFLTCDRGEYVLRGHPHGHWQLVKERAVAERIDADTDLGAPWPYELCDDASLFGWTYAVMPRLDGRSFDDDALRDLDREDRRRYAYELGVGAARLHASTSPTLSHFVGERFVPYDGGLASFVADQLAWWRGWAAKTPGCLSDDDQAWIDGIVAEAGDALAHRCEPVLVHHDYKPNNVLVDDDYRVTGVVDLMEGFYADGDQDLVRSMCSFGERSRGRFLDGYTSLRPLREGATERIALYTAMDRLVLWEYGRRNDLWFPVEMTFRDFAEPFVAQLCELVASRPLIRPAVRLLVVTPDGSLLLQRFVSEDRHRRDGVTSWWVTPGGGVDQGEDVLDAARREAREELGIDLSDIGPEVWSRRHVFDWKDTTLDQRERFFLVRVPERFDPEPGVGADQLLREGVREQRWWTLDEIDAATGVEFAPRDLASLVRRLLAEGPSSEPVDVGV